MPQIPDPVAEAALAHSVPDKVIAACKRTTFLEMWQELLEAWGKYLTNVSDDSSLRGSQLDPAIDVMPVRL
jgi:hypothetical protein